MNASDIAKQEQEEFSRVVSGLETYGIPMSHDVTPITPHRRHRHVEAVHTQPLESFFEAFLQTHNHYLFLFSESELRENFDASEQISAGDNDLPIHIYLVLALGAKASVLPVEDVQNELYIKARLRLLSGDSNADLEMMRVLLLICLFEIDDHVDVSYRFLSMPSLIPILSCQADFSRCCYKHWIGLWI